MRQSSILAAFTAIFFSVCSYAQIPGLTPAKRWDLAGYVKYQGVANLPDSYDNGYDHQLEQRFNYEYRFTKQLRFNASMRNRLLMGDSAELAGYAKSVADDPGYLDLSTNVLDKNGLIANAQFDRLYFDWSNENWQTRAGRFRINWAMNTLWNPNDIFSSYSIYDFAYEERKGSDALLLKRRVALDSSLSLVYNPHQNSELTSYAGRYLFNQNGWDMQLIAGKAQLDYLFAGGLAGDIEGAGVRAELSWFQAKERYLGAQLQDDTLVASLESDYSFTGSNNWLGRIAILYISKPQTALSAQAFLNLPTTARSLSFSEFTYYAELGADLTALSRLTLSGSYYSDGSYSIVASNQYSLADDWQLQTVLQRFAGRDSSLFGQTPSYVVFMQLKWSFAA